jgi:lipoate-protein ligase B
MIQKMTTCRLRDLGLIEYKQAYCLQKACVEELLSGGAPSLLLCEHPVVLTMGRLADEKNKLISEDELSKRGVAVHPIDRGGDITLHAPGQLVIYPILDLAHFGKDLRRYLFQLEKAAIDLLDDFDIVANRFSGRTGVWTGGKKIASIGIGVRRWIAFHGLSVNVNTDLNLFAMIRPCGLDVEMTSMADIKKQKMAMHKVKEKIVDCFSRNFQLEWIRN